MSTALSLAGLLIGFISILGLPVMGYFGIRRYRIRIARFAVYVLGHHPDHRASREVDGPLSGPYELQSSRRPLCGSSAVG